MTDKYDDFYPTDEELEKLEPISKIDPKLLNAYESGELKKHGRPHKENKKVPMSLRVKPEILAAFKDTGKGWQTRANQALEEWVEKHPQ